MIVFLHVLTSAVPDFFGFLTHSDLIGFYSRIDSQRYFGRTIWMSLFLVEVLIYHFHDISRVYHKLDISQNKKSKTFVSRYFQTSFSLFSLWVLHKENNVCSCVVWQNYFSRDWTLGKYMVKKRQKSGKITPPLLNAEIRIL